MGKIFSVTVDNHASHSAFFMVFQSDPTQWAPNALSLAWFAKYSNPGQNSRTRFQWTVDTGFSWAETGELQPGVQFAAAETYEPTGGSNRISLDCENGVYRFAYPSWGADPSRFYLAETANIPARSQACVGVTMSGSTVYAVQARPNQNLAFSPRPRYFSTVNNPLELAFPPGVHALTTTLHADGSWTRPIPLARANEQRLRLLSV
jgi:rhizosphere induced protein